MNEAEGNNALLDSPFVGLMPYEERHAPIFFGRDTDWEKIIANLRAARLTVFYGPSGVGKSSVLRAGVISHLRQRAQPAGEEGSPEFAVVYYKDWVNDPLAGLAASIEEGISAALPDEPFEPVPPSRDLPQMLAAWTGRFGLELLIILDQFEEYFLYRASESGAGTFAEEFPKAVNRRDLPVRFLISLREDALSKLDCFRGSIPTLFNNRLQLGHLRDDDARAAIREPIPAYNKLLPPGAEPFDIEQNLVEAVLEQVSRLKQKLGGIGQGTVSGRPAQLEIESPYLQLVMMRIWETERKAGSRRLREQTLLRELGGAEQIVREHLDAVMNGLPMVEKEVAAAIFKYLVTPVGGKIAHAVESLIKYSLEETECTERDVKNLLRRLEAGDQRILYPLKLRAGQAELDGYQIFHDALAPAILGWRTRYLIERDKRITIEEAAREQKRLEEESARERERLEQEAVREHERLKKEAERARRRALVVGTAILLTAIISAGSAIFYLTKYKHELAVTVKLDAVAAVQEKKLEALNDLATADEARQKKGVDKLEQLKRNGVDLSSVGPLVKEVAKEKGAALSIQVDNVLDTRSRPTQMPKDQEKPRVYIHIQDERQREDARRIKGLLENGSGYDVPGIELVSRGRFPRNELRYFRDEDLDMAKAIVKILRQQLEIGEPKRIGGFENSPYIRSKHFELWCKAAEDTTPYTRQRQQAY
jgi:hypothetical protein